MCILFINIAAAPKPGQFKLIVASNRDEFFSRSTEPAHFWKEDGEIIGGRDMSEKKEGGTWLAVSKKGKMGIVLNLSGSNADREKLGRGFLVVDYLKSSEPGALHLESLKNVSQQYNGFHLITIEFNEKPVLSHYSNGNPSEVTSVSDGTFAAGNCPFNKPYEKVKKGKIRFEDILDKYNDTKNQEKLVEELVALLKWEEKHVNPSEEEMTHLPPSMRDPLKSVFVNVPSAGYGTRTHTIVLVAENGQTDFYEWTLEEPIGSSNRKWLSTHEKFQIQTKL